MTHTVRWPQRSTLRACQACNRVGSESCAFTASGGEGGPEPLARDERRSREQSLPLCHTKFERACRSRLFSQKYLIFNQLYACLRPKVATLRDTEELTKRAVIHMVIFAPLTGSSRVFIPNQHGADAFGKKNNRQFVRCARSSVG